MAQETRQVGDRPAETPLGVKGSGTKWPDILVSIEWWGPGQGESSSWTHDVTGHGWDSE